jgi:LPPG:FO 2-phospho-L-lactate transferase
LKVVALAGGTGSAKLLRGLQQLPVELTVVANVGDNFRVQGLYVCPDIDIAVYALAGISDRSHGWGVEGDTFNALARLGDIGQETWFRLGDKDMALSVYRTSQLRGGATLTAVTDKVRRALGVEATVLPVTDSQVETRVITPGGDLHLQEFWVRERGSPGVVGVRYDGASSAKVTHQVRAALSAADRVLLCPANPVTSIGPILAIPGLRGMLKKARSKVVALSPMSGGAPFSGPAGKFMKALGHTPDSLGVAKLYSDFLDVIMISAGDARLRMKIEALGVGCVLTDTRLNSRRDEVRLAKELLEA